jgi:orotate phosphoribosyltransferase
MDYQAKTRKILKDVKAFVDGGHFVYSSGYHGDFYINKDALYAYPKKLDDIGAMLTTIVEERFCTDIDTVLSPAVAGIILGQSVAYNLSLNMDKDILFAYADRHSDDKSLRTIRRGYSSFVQNKKVLLIDDMVTTGATLVGLAKAVLALGGEVVGAGVICDRGKVRTIKYDVDVVGVGGEVSIAPLVELDTQIFKQSDCPLCKSGRPVDTELGEGVKVNLIKMAEKIKMSSGVE